MNICILGDGNFSFSHSLVKQYKKDPEFIKDWLESKDLLKIVSCSLDSKSEILKKYPEFKDYRWPDWVEIRHDINALELPESLWNFDIYIWNHPHIGIEDLTLHTSLLYNFFKSMSKCNAKKVIISLIKGQFERWNVLESANEHFYFLSSTRIISETDFKEWKAVRNTSGKSFKNNPTISRSTSKISTRFIFTLDSNSQISFLEQELSTLVLENTKKEICHECSKPFYCKRGLKQHVHMVHVLKKFGSDWSFDGPLKYKCNKCDKCFKSQKDLETHQKALHLDLSLSGRFCARERLYSAFQVSSLLKVNLLKRNLSNELKSSLEKAIKDNKVLVFIKGTKTEPQCGFSRAVLQILELNGVKEFSFVNVLENQETRDGIKEYTNWPTIPQVFVNGEFIGGCDILINMHQSGELEKLLKTIE